MCIVHRQAHRDVVQGIDIHTWTGKARLSPQGRSGPVDPHRRELSRVSEVRDHLSPVFKGLLV